MEAQAGVKQDEARRCTEAMRDLFQSFRGRVEEELRGSGVTLSQLRMLKTIGEQTEGSAASIARMCHVTPQTLHAMLARAVREGWIVRGTSDRNHRFVTASLTPQGHAIVQNGVKLRERFEAEMWSDVQVSALIGFREMLERALANLQPIPAKPDGRVRHPTP